MCQFLLSRAILTRCFTKLYSINGHVHFTPAGNKGSCNPVHVRSVTGARATRISVV